MQSLKGKKKPSYATFSTCFVCKVVMHYLLPCPPGRRPSGSGRLKMDRVNINKGGRLNLLFYVHACKIVRLWWFDVISNAFSIYAAIFQRAVQKWVTHNYYGIARPWQPSQLAVKKACKWPKMPQCLIFDDFDTNCLSDPKCHYNRVQITDGFTIWHLKSAINSSKAFIICCNKWQRAGRVFAESQASQML